MGIYLHLQISKGSGLLPSVKRFWRLSWPMRRKLERVNYPKVSSKGSCLMRIDLVPVGRGTYPWCSVLPVLCAGVHRASTRKHSCPFSCTTYSSTRQRELCTCSVSLTLCAVGWNGSCRLSGVLVEITEEEEKKMWKKLVFSHEGHDEVGCEIRLQCLCTVRERRTVKDNCRYALWLMATLH